MPEKKRLQKKKPNQKPVQQQYRSKKNNNPRSVFYSSTSIYRHTTKIVAKSWMKKWMNHARVQSTSGLECEREVSLLT